MGKKLKPYFLDEVVSRTSCGEIGNRATGGFIAILSLFQIIKKMIVYRIVCLTKQGTRCCLKCHKIFFFFLIIIQSYIHNACLKADLHYSGALVRVTIQSQTLWIEFRLVFNRCDVLRHRPTATFMVRSFLTSSPRMK